MSYAARAEERFRRTPSNRNFAMEIVSCAEGRAELRMPVQDGYVQEEGVIHGGVLTTLADTAAVYTLIGGLGEEEVMTSIELKLNFLRPALPREGELRALAAWVQRGRKVAVVEVDVWQGEKRVARGLFTYLIWPKANP